MSRSWQSRDDVRNRLGRRGNGKHRGGLNTVARRGNKAVALGGVLIGGRNEFGGEHFKDVGRPERAAVGPGVYAVVAGNCDGPMRLHRPVVSRQVGHELVGHRRTEAGHES